MGGKGFTDLKVVSNYTEKSVLNFVYDEGRVMSGYSTHDGIIANCNNCGYNAMCVQKSLVFLIDPKS